MSSQASVLATSIQSLLRSTFLLSSSPFFPGTTFLYLKNGPESILLYLKKKKKVINLTVVPGPPSLGSWPEHDGNFGPGGVLKLVVLAKCYGTPQAASTWGSLLMITGKLGGIDGFGKHFCRVSLTEKRKGIWYMLIDRLFQKSVQKYKI